MKRYLMFCGNEEPIGGWGDFYQSFDNLEIAKKECERLNNLSGLDIISKPKWIHIIDLTNEETVFIPKMD